MSYPLIDQEPRVQFSGVARTEWCSQAERFHRHRPGEALAFNHGRGLAMSPVRRQWTAVGDLESSRGDLRPRCHDRRKIESDHHL